MADVVCALAEIHIQGRQRLRNGRQDPERQFVLNERGVLQRLQQALRSPRGIVGELLIFLKNFLEKGSPR